MTNFLLFAAGFLLGASAFGMLAILMLAHKPPPSPTLHARRKYRDAVVEVDRECGIRYEHLGMTGLEE